MTSKYRSFIFFLFIFFNSTGLCFLFYFFLCLAVLGLRFCVRAFSSCGKWGPLFIVVRGPLTIAASLVAEHRLQMRRLSSCGSQAQLHHGMWDLPRPGLEPVSPALAGRFSTTAPPGKPRSFIFDDNLVSKICYKCKMHIGFQRINMKNYKLSCFIFVLITCWNFILGLSG